MIYAKAQQEGKPFFEVLDYYLNLIRKLHQRTYDYLGEMKASTNPLAYCEGGFYGGNLGLYDKIKPLLKSATASFGITALNELQQLHNKKSLAEDGHLRWRHWNTSTNVWKNLRMKTDICMRFTEHRQRISAEFRCSSSAKSMESLKMYRTENMSATVFTVM